MLPSAVIGGRVADGRRHLAVAHGTDGWLLARLPPWAQREALRGVTHLRCAHPGIAPTHAAVETSVAPMGVSLPNVARAPDAAPRWWWSRGWCR
ncbi:MAG: hypothetical protein U0325_34830 [Polyangiales bacterium]